ncbi:MAG: hypothetical protein ABEI78_01625 [Candidatus Nanohaloarchaea archaeon]
MSLEEKKEEAEAVVDSAEMVLETVPEPRSGKAKKLETKTRELEQQIQDPDSEQKIDSLITEVRDLMDEVQEDVMDEPEMGMDDELGGNQGYGPEDPGGEPGGEPPPF